MVYLGKDRRNDEGWRGGIPRNNHRGGWGEEKKKRITDKNSLKKKQTQARVLHQR